MGGLFAASLAGYMVYGRGLATPANTGFALNQASKFIESSTDIASTNVIFQSGSAP